MHGQLPSRYHRTLGIPLAVVAPSTTGANPVDWVETGWTELQVSGVEATPWTDTAAFFAKVRLVGSNPTLSVRGATSVSTTRSGAVSVALVRRKPPGTGRPARSVELGRRVFIVGAQIAADNEAVAIASEY
jgi:hypothetical protein